MREGRSEEGIIVREGRSEEGDYCEEGEGKVYHERVEMRDCLTRMVYVLLTTSHTYQQAECLPCIDVWIVEKTFQMIST